MHPVSIDCLISLTTIRRVFWKPEFRFLNFYFVIKMLIYWPSLKFTYMMRHYCSNYYIAGKAQSTPYLKEHQTCSATVFSYRLNTYTEGDEASFLR